MVEPDKASVIVLVLDEIGTSSMVYCASLPYTNAAPLAPTVPTTTPKAFGPLRIPAPVKICISVLSPVAVDSTTTFSPAGVETVRADTPTPALLMSCTACSSVALARIVMVLEVTLESGANVAPVPEPLVASGVILPNCNVMLEGVLKLLIVCPAVNVPASMVLPA